MSARLAGYGVISLLLKWFAMDFLQEYESSDSEATDVYNSTNIDVKATTSCKKTWDIVPNLDVKGTYKVLAF